MLAFTFPGQGSQKPAMGDPWRDEPSWALVAEASAATGRNVAELLLHTDAEELKLTHNAQLATFVMSMVVLDAVRRRGISASRMAGHSLGEYSALVAAGVIDFATGCRLVAERGAAMREASVQRVGTMAAVLGLEDDLVAAACAEVRVSGGEVWLANANAPGQVVIAGSAEALQLAGAAAKARGAKAVMPVAVSGAFHTPYMSSAQTRLDAALATVAFADAVVPVGANVDASLHQTARDWPDLLSRQLCSPVLWRQLLGSLVHDGVSVLVELGPGKVLTGMAKRTAEGIPTLSASTPQEVDKLVTDLAQIAPDAMAPTDGEHLFAVERLVVSPAAGVFSPDANLYDGHRVEVGDVLGRVGEHEVRSRFTGWLMGLLAHHGERVTNRQPVAWLRTAP